MDAEQQSSLSPSQTARALRVFHVNAALWAAWATSSGLGTTVFTGYLLWLGLQEADIAYLISVSFFVSLVQMPLLKYTRRVRNTKALVVGCGTFEILFRFLVIAVPIVFLNTSYRVISIYVLTVLGLCFGYAASPTFNDWLAQAIPEKLRARFTGQRTLVSMLTAMAAGYLFGKFLDMFPEGDARLPAFRWLLLVGLITGLGGYLILLRTPMPDLSGGSSKGILEALADILRNKSFVSLLAFIVLWQFAVGLSSPFMSVFMIQDLKLSYTTMAIYGNIAMAATVLSYRPLAGLVTRFGSKPVIQVMLIPGVIGQFLRVFSKPDFHLLLPVSFTCFAIFSAAVTVAVTPLFYGMLPKERDRTAYFAAWTSMVFLFGGIAPLLGGIIATRLEGFEFQWLGFPIGNLQIVFMVTTALLLGLFPLVLLMEERKATSATGLIAQVWKGSPVYYLFNFFAMNVIGGEVHRARAATGMGRSGSPLAAEELIKALTDLSPGVRRRAVEGLGLLGTDEAVGPLMEQLADKESDIRAEAAEALGKIRHPLGLDALREALDDHDPRVRISALRGLGEIGGDGVRDLLLERLRQAYDRETFPTIVDVLSRMNDVRAVTQAIERLPEYASPVIRAQLLSSACRALGAGETFYRLTVMDELQQATRIASALERAQKDASVIRGEAAPIRDQLVARIRDLRASFEQGDSRKVYAGMVEMARLIAEGTGPSGARSSQEVTVARGTAGALLLLSDAIPAEEVGPQEFLFATVCITLSVQALRKEDQRQ